MNHFRSIMARIDGLAAVLAVVLLVSCKTKADAVIEGHEDLFKSEFLHHSLLSRGDIIELQIYNGDLVNDYFFQRSKEAFRLTRDSLQFAITDIAGYAGVDTADESKYARQLEDIVRQLYLKMQQADVHSFTSEFHKFGIDLVINIKDEKLVYVTDPARVTNPEWVKFLQQSKQVKEHWYVYKTP